MYRHNLRREKIKENGYIHGFELSNSGCPPGCGWSGRKGYCWVKKLHDAQEFKSKFSGVQLIISLVIGGVAGMLGVVTLMGQPVDKKFLFGLIAFGYAGADFIEGFMQTVLPKGG